MELKGEGYEPVSPTGQYLNSSVLSLYIIAVLESESPIDGTRTATVLTNGFLPISPRFSSIMVVDRKGVKRWKKVEVNLENHIHFPSFPSGMPPEFYDNCLTDYLSQLSTEQLPQNRPLWEIHLIKYPTSNTAGSIIFKLHHALGDGFSLMGALLSCLKRADNPSLPLTFPSVQLHSRKNGGKNSRICRKVPEFLSLICNNVSDLFWGPIKTSFVKDDITPIRSGDVGIEFRPVTVSTISFSLDQIKQIKGKLRVTINDVICGIIFLGTRLYMQAMDQKSSNARSTALVLLNTRMFRSYKSIKDMVKPDAESRWGNHFAFLDVPVPKLANGESINPLEFVQKAQKIIKRKRNSIGVYVTARLLQILKTLKGPEAAARFIHKTLENTTMGITNMIGPVEQMALASHPVRGLYFMISGAPHSLMAAIVSYMGTLRVAITVEKDFIDPQKFNSFVEIAFDMIFKAACESPSQSN